MRICRPIKLSKTDEYVILDNRYIDVSKWKKVHPGSLNAIKNHLKEDISYLFRQITHSKNAWSIILTLQKHWIHNSKIVDYK
jgi:cytochrome b involved in lipid metabolism